ncbi:GntR family transcriptional regulator [Aggregatilinea lenta]|uniref:GntR family transcriptional regulator n=1 Tax=Aggregatilinea lenta TaxID=913108 RepID=UPI000E5BDFAE|nr:GntR family transcriptional regulator [Aggregatilinea lenta]
MSLSQNNGKITYVSFTDECYARIQSDILDGKIRWGERLDVSTLAEAYGVSRSPVVKAIERLAHEGLVEIVPNKGSYVRTPTKKDIIEVTEIRFAVEALNVELAYKKRKEALLEQLAEQDRTIAVFEERGEQIPEEVFLAYDREFHWTFAVAAGNSRLLNIIDVNRNQVELFRIRTYSRDKAKQSIARHRAIVQCLQQDQLVEAVRVLRQHIYEVGEFAIETVVTEAY